MIDRMLIKDTIKRPTAELLLLDPYFQVKPIGLSFNTASPCTLDYIPLKR